MNLSNFENIGQTIEILKNFNKVLFLTCNARSHPMCSKVTCEICKKATWSGCGEHIEEALEGVAEADRCSC
jgi:hypothetical protein